MKRNRWGTLLWSVVLSFLLAYGSVGAMATGFGLEYGWGLILGLALAAVLGSVSFLFFGGLPLALSLLALVCGYFWRTGDLVLQTQALLRRISSCYNSAYGWGVLSWPGVNLTGVPAVIPMLLLGVMIALAVAWTVCRRQSAWLAVGFACLPVALCCVVTDTVPGSGVLYVFLLGLLLLLMTQSLRRQEESQGNRLTAWLLIPVVLGLSLLFWLVPRESHKPLDQTLSQKFLDWYDAHWGQTTGQVTGNQATSGIRVENVDLRELGQLREYRYEVMTVRAPTTGMLYLRGNAYDLYDGSSWGVSPGDWTLAYDFWRGDKALGTVEIETPRSYDVLYFPYSPVGGPSRLETAGCYVNEKDWKSYSFTQYRMDGYGVYLEGVATRRTVDPEAMSQYLQLPEETRQRAQKYLLENWTGTIYATPEYQTLEIAEAIGRLVAGTAAYDLDPSRMPEDAADFAMWFLESGTSGYCVHYATAATVLLRAANIPARYVTGYLVGTEAGTRTKVLGKDAHAWVEYWHPECGWLMLEVTPGEERAPETEPTEPATEPEPTLPEDEVPSAPTTSPTPPTEEEPAGLPGMVPAVPESPRKPELRWTPAMTLVTVVLGLAGILVGQWRLRLRYRQNRLRRGSANRKGLYRWRILERRWKLLKLPVEQEAYLVAAKAKFSRHKLTPEDLAVLDRWLETTEKQLRQQNFLWRMVHRLIFAEY